MKEGSMKESPPSSLDQLISIYKDREDNYNSRLNDFEMMRKDIEAVEEPRIKKNELYIKLAIAACVVSVIGYIYLQFI